MNRIKVLHLITHMGVGGAGDNTLLTVEGLSRNRYEVHLGAGQHDEDYTSWESRARQCADQYFYFPDLRRPVHPLHDARALRQLTDFIRDQQYDIVHTHCAKAGILGRLAARRAGVPIVMHTYHLFAWQGAHRFHRFGWQNLLSSLKKQSYFWVERHSAGLSDALITVSELNKQEAIACKLAPREKLTTIYSGIDLDRFDVELDRNEVCDGLNLDPRRPIVGTVGRLSEQKAPLDFVRAAKVVLERKPDVQFIMIGDGPLLAQVQKAIRDEPRIRLLGFQDKVPEILSVLSVFALSSLWEGLGRALTEAMIMAAPVAATDVDGMPELVSHGTTGLLSPPRDPPRLAENILWLLEHPQEAREMGQRGRQRVVPEFCAKRMVERIDGLYERLLGEKRLAPLQSAAALANVHSVAPLT